MILTSYTASAVMAAALQGAPAAGTVDLFCRGRGDRLATTQTKFREADGSTTNRNESRRIPFDSAIRIKVAGGTGQALIPDAMLADDDARGWHDITKLVATPQAINGKVNFNWLYSPVMSLNRATGTLRITGSMSNFSGSCTQFDPRTSRVPVAAARAPSMASSYASSSDPRAAARQMATQTTLGGTRDAARSAAMKADLAFRLFNAGTSPITSFAMLSASGVPSSNWLRAGESVAPRAFRSMTFAVGKACSHRAQINFASGARVVRAVNLCGKNILYATPADAWAE